MHFDLILVGGGLQNVLVALAMRARRPGLRIALIEREQRLGGNHLWSFHEHDVPAEARAFVEPLVIARWPGYQVAFPGVRRTFDSAYASISSDRLHQVGAAALGDDLLLGEPVLAVAADHVDLVSGRRLEAPLIIDARGPLRLPIAGEVGWQKFLGLECRLLRPSGFDLPLVMDATVPQTDGFRFLYLLPLAPDRVLLEDTYFADSPALDRPKLRACLLALAAERGLLVSHVEREESGALPLPWHAGALPGAHSPLAGGYAGGFFHPTTGYSFPVALRLALHLAEHIEDPFGPAFARFRRRHARQLRFATFLNRLLFAATAPQHRRDVLERFHRLPDATIRRFYALETTGADRARIVCGRPPRGTSLRAALAQVVAR